MLANLIRPVEWVIINNQKLKLFLNLYQWILQKKYNDLQISLTILEFIKKVSFNMVATDGFFHHTFLQVFYNVMHYNTIHADSIQII